ncbi:MAG TPA: glutathione S-transferase family protein [Bdellovibrionales bacterium]|nr:glutathione S-transferase family protein [Bdellovibrionales bacterium]
MAQTERLHLIIGNKNYSSWSLRPWLAMRLFKIPFEETVIPLDQPDTAEKIRRFSPSGRVPFLMGETVRIWDSLAICEMLNEMYPDKKMWPQNLAERAHARSISNEMHAGFQTLRNLCPMKVREKFENFDYSAAQPDIDRISAIWTQCLERNSQRGPFLFGEPTLADCMYAPVVFRFNTYGVKLNDVCQKYVNHMLSIPAMKEWAAGAKAETFAMERYEAKK